MYLSFNFVQSVKSFLDLYKFDPYAKLIERYCGKDYFPKPIKSEIIFGLNKKMIGMESTYPDPTGDWKVTTLFSV